MTLPQIAMPASYDIDHLIEKSKAVHHEGDLFDQDTGDRLFRFKPYRDNAAGIDVSFDSVLAVVEAYPVSYLEVIRPKLLAQASKARDARIAGFQFSGMAIPLDDATRNNIQGAALGLARNEDEETISWSMGGGVFVDIPREAMFALADAAFLHVQRCFKAHKAIAARVIAAETIDDLADLDVDARFDEQLSA